jgi:catechol 2,3-dioxygenase-like lactoylglutathione lyase family enzyme
MADEIPAILHHVSVGTNDFDKASVFYNAALAAGGVRDAEPGRRPDYGPDYYGAFVRDPDGHKIEAALAHE